MGTLLNEQDNGDEDASLLGPTFLRRVMREKGDPE